MGMVNAPKAIRKNGFTNCMAKVNKNPGWFARIFYHNVVCGVVGAQNFVPLRN